MNNRLKSGGIEILIEKNLYTLVSTQKKIYNLYTDYPEKLTPEQKEE